MDLKEEWIKQVDETLLAWYGKNFEPNVGTAIVDGLLESPALRELLDKAEKWDAYQAELANDKAHTDRFIAIMDAEEDELRRDAEKWRKVEEIAKRARKDDGCRGCPLEKSGCHPCYNAITVVNALSEVPHGK